MRSKAVDALLLMLVAVIQPLLAQDLAGLKDRTPVGFNGNLELRGLYYNANGILDRRQPFTYLISGSPTLSLYGWNIPFSFMVSKNERSFRQPFNQFGMSPTYKWVTLHAGYRNITFSQFTLAGHTMLGGGLEIYPGKLRAGFMYGRLNRATVIDTATQSLVPFSFSRKGMAGKLGFGTIDNHFDLTFLHAKDDSTSGPVIPMHDSTRVLAAANTVLGYSFKLLLLKKISIESDGAASIYTRDINSPITFDSIADPLLKRLAGSFDVNGSTEWFLAFNAAIGYREKNYGIKINYRRIEPEFKTMGAYFFASDVENLTINPNFNLPNGKLRVNASIGIQQDNVNLQKQATTKRVIGSAVLGAEITDRLGVDINYSNFANNQRPNTLRFADSLKIVQTTQTLAFMPRYTIIGERMTHLVMLSLNLSGMKDYNSYFEQDANNRNIKTNQYLLNYNISFPGKLLAVFANLSHTAMEGGGMETSYSGVTAGSNYSLLQQKLQTGISASLMQGNAPSGKSKILNSSLNLNYRISNWQSVRAMFFLTNNNPGSVVTGTNPAFTETRCELAYQINFGL